MEDDVDYLVDGNDDFLTILMVGSTHSNHSPACFYCYFSFCCYQPFFLVVFCFLSVVIWIFSSQSLSSDGGDEVLLCGCEVFATIIIVL